MATKTSGELEREFIDTLAASTGRDLAGWLQEIEASGVTKRNDIINWLKQSHNFGHMNASLLVGLHANDGKPVYGSTDELLENQFAKAEDMRPLYEAFIAFAREHFPGVTILPKKTYVSLLEKREFAAINIKKQELRLGFDLGDRSFDETVGKSKLTGPMPRISHMFTLTEPRQLTGEIAALLRDSYNRSH